MKQTLLIIIFLLNFSGRSIENKHINAEMIYEITEHKINVRQVIEKPKKQHNNYFFNKVINQIKKNEGFSSIPYKDINGYETIGYGNLIEYIPKEYHNYISKEDADHILREKVYNLISYARKSYKGYNHNQYLGIASLAYNKGFGRIQKHKLHNALLNKENVYDIWINFSKYEVERDNYRNARLFELEMFYKK